MLAGKHGRGAPPLAVLEPLLQSGQVELCDARPQRRELAEELLSPLGGGGLERQGAQPLLDLSLDVTRALDLDRNARELELGSMLAAFEAAEPGGFLQQLAPLLGLRAEDLLHSALANDRVHAAAEPEVGEQLDEIDAPHCRAVEQVLPLAAAVQPSRDRQLGVRQRPVAVGIVEEQLDLAEVLGRTAAAARKENVVRLLGPKLRRSHRPGRPDDRVGDVRLPRAVRPDDHGDARLESNLDRFRERLEAAQLDGA